MCGLTALFYNPCNTTTPRNHTNEMMASLNIMKRRGPDRGKMLWDNDKIIGFQRLCINDLSDNGDQPMKEGTATLICNGEIFNYNDLVEKYDLKNKLKSKSDCEVILHLYQKLGFRDTIENLDGDFAVVIHDENNVYVARDRIGVRPLFYGYTPDKDLVISSEAKALFFCDSIQQIIPGKLYFFQLNEHYLEPTFYTQNYFKLEKSLYVDNQGSALRELLIDAVRKRLLTDRPIACLLSGGLDSSIIASILCKLVGPKNVRTYSIGMKDSLDLKYARVVADYLGTQHIDVLFTPKEGIQAIPEVIYAIETYDITTVRASVGMYLLGKYIADSTRDIVIFSGEGSDELLCGYLYFHYAPTANDAHNESLRLINQLYKYDVKRADACISSHGLELRVPFLDRDVLDYCISLPGEIKQPKNGMEKSLLRSLFKDDLPECVINRRKDGFSDGVSGKKAWYEYIQEHIKQNGFESEADYYKNIYDANFRHYPNPIDEFWMPKWINAGTNPSGRILGVFDSQHN